MRVREGKVFFQMNFPTFGMQTFVLFTCLLMSGIRAAAQEQRGDERIPFPIGKSTIESRDGSRIDVVYGRIEVPENRSDPNSRSIQLAYMWVKSPMQRKGTTVFPLAGGPGGDSIGMVTRSLIGGGQLYLRWMGGDIVALDQRGTGQSIPNLESSFERSVPTDLGTDRNIELAALSKIYAAEADRWRQQGVDLNGYTTVESADDINDLRKHLGLEKVSLWGGSYGTHLAMATIRRHGECIDRAVLIGPEGPDHTVKLPSYAQEGLNRIASLIAKHRQLSQRIPDFLELVKEVLDTLPKQVVVSGETVEISRYDLQSRLANMIGNDPNEIAKVPLLLLKMKTGDYEEFASELLSRRKRSTRSYSAMQMIMDSASGLSAERAALIEKQKEDCLLGDSVNGLFPDIASAWDAPDLGDSFRSELRSTVPILFIAGDLDSRTPVSNARELMQYLPNSHLITVENAAHAVRWNQHDLAEAWSSFLRGEAPTVRHVVAEPIRFALPDDIQPPSPPNAIEISKAVLESSTGEFEFDNGMIMEITTAKNRLIATIKGRGTYDLWPKTADEYFALNANIPVLKFIRDGNGQAIAIQGGGVEGKLLPP